MALKLQEHMEKIFSESEHFSDKDGNLYVTEILKAIESIDAELVEILISDETAQKAFFTKVNDVYVLNQLALIEFFTSKDHMKNNSYTAYSKQIGLIKKDNFIQKGDDIVLAFPYKDCVLEGGQKREDEKKKETFYNSIISRDEIDRLFEPKAFTNIKKYTQDGIEDNPVINKKDNLIIKGNNLIALKTLETKYAGEVKLIYIDPPYNTENDSFKYNDKFKHSTWLTFMKNRLEVAKELLSDDGVLLISLDDKEVHYLKVLMDEIFDRENFVGNIAWESKTKSQNTKTSFNKLQPKVEYILLYTKKNCRRFNLIKTAEKEYPLSDVNGNYREYTLEPMNAKGTRGRTSMVFDIDGISPPAGKQWQLGKDTISEYKKRKDLFIKDKKVILKMRPEDEKTDVTEPFWGLLNKDIGTAESAKKELTKILGTDKHGFETVKPVELIKRLVFHTTNKDDIILDFFGGSGTTAHAVLKLNKEDNGNRQFIIIEQMDYIEDITCTRVQKVIENHKEGNFIYAELNEISNFKESEIGALNQNMQYLPFSEIEDEDYNISGDEIASNKSFYGVEDE